jgi:hypothetical protein
MTRMMSEEHQHTDRPRSDQQRKIATEALIGMASDGWIEAGDDEVPIDHRGWARKRKRECKEMDGDKRYGWR